jgi:DNA polymerase I-like protein with 3'-5' exonuclease and polymerase domains
VSGPERQSFVLTNAMRAALHALDLRDSEIANLTPQQVRLILDDSTDPTAADATPTGPTGPTAFLEKSWPSEPLVETVVSRSDDHPKVARAEEAHQPAPRQHTQFLRLARRYIVAAIRKAEGLRLCFDGEGDGLVNAGTKTHCIAVEDLDSDRIDEFGPGQIDDALARLSQANCLIGHNIIGYDLPRLHRLHGWTPSEGCAVIDTLIVSRLVLANIAALDDQAAAMGDPKLGKLRGRHSLKAWGTRLGIPKVGDDIETWAEFTPEMQERCAGDVLLTKALFQFLQPDGQPQAALSLEHRVATICDEITATGIPFDRAAAEQRQKQWAARCNELESRLRQQFPQIKNLNSRQQIAKLLEERGWVPEKRTKKLQHAKIDDEALASVIALYPEFDGLLEHFVLGRRLGLLSEGKEAWLRHVGPDGRIHGSIIHIGTPHSRAAHMRPNIAQVPNPKKGKPFAAECRELFRTANDWAFVTCDQAGLQDRAFAHYLAAFDGGAYAKAFVAGLDPHWAAVAALGLLPAGTVRDKENRLHTVLREGCKSWRYGFLFGMWTLRAGTLLLNTIKAAEAVDPACGLTRRFFGAGVPNTAALRRIGFEALAKFVAATPGLWQLRQSLEAQARKGWVPGLDGRRVPVDALYKALNYTVASAEAILCKRWLAHVHDELHARFHYGWDGDVVIVAWIHDEIVCCCRSEIADQVGEIMVRWAIEAGEHYSLRLPLDASYDTGRSWAGNPSNQSNEVEVEPAPAPKPAPEAGSAADAAQKVEPAPAPAPVPAPALAPEPAAADEPPAAPAPAPAPVPATAGKPPAGIYNGTDVRTMRPAQSAIAFPAFDGREVPTIDLAELIDEPVPKSRKICCRFHDETTPSLHIYRDHYYCFGCHAYGDHLDWLMQVGGLDHIAAQAVLTNWTGPVIPRHAATGLALEELEQAASNRAYALRWWDAAEPIRGTLAARYLADTRGIDLGALPSKVDDILRFHPRCVFSPGKRLPCLLALMRDPISDVPTGIQRIALTPEAQKVDRMALGTAGVVKLWPAGKQLVAGEGLETVLAAATRLSYRGEPLRPAWAALGALKRLPLVPGVERLIVLADNDANNAGADAAEALKRRWLEAGRRVALLMPDRPGTDFNDIVLADLERTP